MTNAHLPKWVLRNVSRSFPYTYGLQATLTQRMIFVLFTAKMENNQNNADEQVTVLTEPCNVLGNDIHSSNVKPALSEETVTPIETKTLPNGLHPDAAKCMGFNGNALHGILKKPSPSPSSSSLHGNGVNGKNGVVVDPNGDGVDNSVRSSQSKNDSSPYVYFRNGHHDKTHLVVNPIFIVGSQPHDNEETAEGGWKGHATFAEPPLTQGITGKSSVMQRMFPKKKNMPRSFTVEDLKKDINMDDHLVPVPELCARLDVDPDKGLTEEEAKKRLARDGKNELTPLKEIPEIIKFLEELVGGFSPLLLAGSLLCLIAFFIQFFDNQPGVTKDNLILAIVLFAVVIITGIFLYAQKAKSARIMASFKKMLPQHANVFRDGEEKNILADDVVLGDIVIVNSGDRIPADIRVLESKGLKVDNSSLSGESEPQPRLTSSAENPLESRNLCFYTTNAVMGWGRGIVIRRGDQSVLGRIAKLTLRLDVTETTIAKEIRAFVVLISIVAVMMGVICCIIPLSLGYNFLTTVILAIGLIVANVPEGIVIAVTVMLTLSAKRMAKKNCLIKNLEAVEALGSCSIICTDKTGTLTQNRMTVSHCWVDNSFVAVNTTDEALVGQDLPKSITMHDLIRIATLCNRAHFKRDQATVAIYSKEVLGDASESALLKFVEALDAHPDQVRVEHKPLVEIPFNSTTKFQVSIHEMEHNENGEKKGYLLVMKGAPEQIWSRCSMVATNRGDQKIDTNWTGTFNEAYKKLGSQGERVLGFCDLWLHPDAFPIPTTFDAENPNFPLEGLRFVGLISLIDPPRSAVPDAVAKCRSAGIRIMMVTGDHPETAKAIGRAVGIISEQSDTVEDIAERLGISVDEVNPEEPSAIVIHGDRLRGMGSEELGSILRRYPEIIFARTSPQQKLIIVEACQKMGAIVAVTGDGVNDSPALKKANIGIAMGITGSDVSKQAADMVLLDDNFASIVTGIEEGRLIFDNLKKTICYSIMSNVPEIVPIVLYFVLNIPLGLTTIPMLLLCLVTDMIPAISMAHESAEGDIMKLPPRDAGDRLVNSRLIHSAYLQAGIICAAGAFFSYFFVFGQCGFWPRDLIGIRARWENRDVEDVRDSYGQEWNYVQRMKLQRVVNTAFFAAVVVFQWSDIVMRKMRRKSILQKGMWNWFLNIAIVLETLFAIMVAYTPGLNSVLNLHDIMAVWWLPVIPFGIYFCLFDEFRRYWIRKHPHGWLEQEFYF